MKRVTSRQVLQYVRSPLYRHQVERDRTKYHRPSEPHQVSDPWDVCDYCGRFVDDCQCIDIEEHRL